MTTTRAPMARPLTDQERAELIRDAAEGDPGELAEPVYCPDYRNPVRAEMYPEPGDIDPETEPRCDHCGGPQDDAPGLEADWNGETGNHSSCEAIEHLTNPDDGPDRSRHTCATCGAPLYALLRIHHHTVEGRDATRTRLHDPAAEPPRYLPLAPSQARDLAGAGVILYRIETE